MKVLFLHGFGSQPGGIKPAFLRDHGHEVINPALPNDDFEESVRIAQQAFEQGHPDMNIDAAETPLILLAPAWRKWGEAATVGPRTVILHSDGDDVVPVDDSRELVRRSGLPEHHLAVVGEDHRMIDAAAFEALREAIDRLGES